MGCDIHQRTFLWSRSIRRYVAVGEVCDYSEHYEIVGDRYYDLFGLFGDNVRSMYPPLDNLNYGLPASLPRTAKLSFKHYGQDYHTISWILLPDLYASISRYIEKLKNPARFLVEDPDSFTETMFDLPEWKEGTSFLLQAVEKIQKSLKWIIDDRDYDKVVDPDKTMFLIYFDN